MWLDNHILIDIDLIFVIARFPKVGFDPTLVFASKEQDSILVTSMKEKYNITKDKRVFSIVSINDKGVWFMVKEFSHKLLRNM